MKPALQGFVLGLFCLLGAACVQLFSSAESEQVQDWKRQTSSLRGLEFTGPVRFERLGDGEIAEVVGQEIAFSMTPEFARRYSDAYAAMGLLPQDYDLLKGLESLYEQELAGMYSPRRRTMFVREQLGQGQDATVIHELVHVLQHQHFATTLELMQGLKRNDDVVSSLGCAVEGDASFTMLGIETQGFFERDARSAGELRDAMLSGLVQGSDAMMKIPRIIRYSLVFPYAHGTVLAQRSYEGRGNPGLDELLVKGPLSTRQVLHPEINAPVDFVKLPFEAIASRLEARGCRLGENNVAGALSLEVLFEEQGDTEPLDAMLRAWSGDRFLQVDCDESWELIWLTRWDTPGAAEEFARRYRRIAGAIAKLSPLSGTPRVLLSGRTALVLTPGALDLASMLQNDSEVRSYQTVDAWVADSCFTESPCPGS